MATVGENPPYSWTKVIDACAGLCARCGQCQYMTISIIHDDCSWYHQCKLTGLKQDIQGFYSMHRPHTVDPPSITTTPKHSARDNDNHIMRVQQSRSKLRGRQPILKTFAKIPRERFKNTRAGARIS